MQTSLLRCLHGARCYIFAASSNFSPRRGLVILIPVQNFSSSIAAYSVKTQFSSIIVIVYTVVACIDRSLGTYI